MQLAACPIGRVGLADVGDNLRLHIVGKVAIDLAGLAVGEYLAPRIVVVGIDSQGADGCGVVGRVVAVGMQGNGHIYRNTQTRLRGVVTTAARQVIDP